MKLSIYNKIIEYKEKGKFIYFNTFTGATVGLTIKEHKVVQNEFKNLNEFKIKYPTIFNKFYRFGFIIDDFRDEKEEVFFKKKESIFLDREYWLFLHPTLDCNFNCWYCYEEHPKEKMSKETYNKIIKHIEYMSNKISGIHLSWFGGEPLMYNDEIVTPISEFTKKLMEKKNLTYRCSITTNGYYIDDKAIASFKKINLSAFQITLDGNKEKHDKVRKHYGEPTFERICNNIINLCNKIDDVNIILRINYDDKTLDYQPDFLEIFPKNIRHKIQVDFRRVWQTVKYEHTINECSIGNPKITNDNLIKWKDYVAKSGFKVSYTKLTPNKHYACYVDKYYHLEIDHEGKVYKCTAKGYTDDYVVGKLRDDGQVELKSDVQAKRFSKLTVDNDICPNCIYLPMCGGVCSQNFMESEDKNMCVLGYTEIPTDQAIIKNYEMSKNENQ